MPCLCPSAVGVRRRPLPIAACRRLPPFVAAAAASHQRHPTPSQKLASCSSRLPPSPPAADSRRLWRIPTTPAAGHHRRQDPNTDDISPMRFLELDAWLQLQATGLHWLRQWDCPQELHPGIGAGRGRGRPEIGPSPSIRKERYI